MNNSVSWKTMENIRNRVYVRLVTNRKKTSKLAANPTSRNWPYSMKILLNPSWSELSWCSITHRLLWNVHPRYHHESGVTSTITTSKRSMEVVQSFYSQTLTVLLMRLQLRTSTRSDISEYVRDKVDASNHPEDHIRESNWPQQEDRGNDGKIFEEFFGLRAKP